MKFLTHVLVELASIVIILLICLALGTFALGLSALIFSTGLEILTGYDFLSHLHHLLGSLL
jgi:hypothetical protein